MLVARIQRDDVVVVTQLPDLDELGLRSVPRILVVQDHRPPVQGLELGGVLRAVDDVLEAVGREVRVVAVETEGEIGGVGEDVGDRRLACGELGGMVPALAEHVEEDPEDPILRLGIPCRRQRVVRLPHAGDLLVASLPGLDDRQEHVVATAGDIAPAGRALLVHGERVPANPEHVQRHIAHELVATAVGTLLHPLQDVRARRRLRLEVTPDHTVELFEAVDDRQVELWDEVGQEDHPPVPIDQKRLHGCSSGSRMCVRVRRTRLPAPAPGRARWRRRGRGAAREPG